MSVTMFTATENRLSQSKYITRTEGAKLYGVTPTTFAAHARRHGLREIEFGIRSKRYLREEVMAMIASVEAGAEVVEAVAR